MEEGSLETKNFDNSLLLALEKSKPQELDAEKLQHGLAKLVMTLVQTITDILERQAMRRVESGTLTGEEVERLGLAFMQIRDRMADIAGKFGLRPEELGIKLSQPFSQQEQATLVDVVDKLIDQGTVIAGDVTIAVAGVDLAALRLLATLTAK
jgi:hypothetical protein